MTQAVEEITVDSGLQAGVSIWYLLEAGIAAATSNVITPTYSSGPSDSSIVASSYTNVNQTGGASTILETAVAESNESTPNPLIADITEAVDNLILSAISCGNPTTATWAADLTEQVDQVSSSSLLGMADRLSTTTNSIECRPTLVSQNRAALASIELDNVDATEFHITGTVLDWGTLDTVASDRCILIKHDGATQASRIYSVIQHQNANGSGVYDFTGIFDNDSRYAVISYNDTGEDRRGVTSDDLTPVAV